MHIKIIESKEVESYREIRLQALKNHPEAFSSSYEESIIYPLEKFKNQLKNEHAYTFGAINDNELVGVVTLLFENKKKLAHRANIVAMYVKPDYRKQGIGKKLVLEAISKAKNTEQIEKVYLAVNSANEPAKKLYKSIGFETYAIEKDAMKIGSQYHDEELMVLDIKYIEKIHM